MIAIINIDKNPRGAGEHLYEVRINQCMICQFKHLREDGLAHCLQLASDAVKQYDMREKAKNLEELAKM